MKKLNNNAEFCVTYFLNPAISVTSWSNSSTYDKNIIINNKVSKFFKNVITIHL